MISDPDPDGAPLASYIDASATFGVRFHCTPCVYSFDVPLLDVIARLKARGLGGRKPGSERSGGSRLSLAPDAGP
jgi:hypothetical protein